MSNVVPFFPANDFKAVAETAAKELTTGLIIGYAADGEMLVFAGGLLDGKQPVCKDWLWLVENFKTKMIAGDYHNQ